MRAMMRANSSLCLAFLKTAARADLGPSQALEDCLRQGLLTGEQRWPGVNLAAEQFGGYLGRLASDTEPGADADAIAAALRSWNLADLYLAAACVSGIESALCLFDEHILRQVPAFIMRLRLSPAQVDEVRQALREKLLFGDGGSEPKIASYKGQASLASFVRVAAVRAGRVELGDGLDLEPESVGEGDGAAWGEQIGLDGVVGEREAAWRDDHVATEIGRAHV